MALARQIGFRARIGLLLVNLGWVATELEQYVQAEAYWRESGELANQLGNTWLICGSLKFLGDLLVLQDRYEEAEATFYTVLEIAGEGNQRMKGEALFGLAENLKKQGDFAGARKQAEASLAVFEPMNSYFTNIVRQWLDTLPANASA